MNVIADLGAPCVKWSWWRDCGRLGLFSRRLRGYHLATPGIRGVWHIPRQVANDEAIQ